MASATEPTRNPPSATGGADPSITPAAAAPPPPPAPAPEEEDDIDPGTGDLFADPQDYYPPTPPPKQESYALPSAPGRPITLHLVGHSPLEAHHLWNGSRVLADYLDADPGGTVRGRTVLELGAGAGLPSLAAAVLGARRVVVTDYPDAELVETMWRNVDGVEDMVLAARGGRSSAGGGGEEEEEEADDDGSKMKKKKQSVLLADGHVWGADPTPLLAHLADLPPPQDKKFDVLILADLLFRHTEHGNMLRTVEATLRRCGDARAYVFFTSYRPWLRDKDFAFFELARQRGFAVDKVVERRMEKPLFENDPGDVDVLKTVTGWALTWPEGSWDER